MARSFGTLFKITQTTGKDLENTSLMKTEIEVLLLPYTPFEVVKINMEGNQQIFHLLEVPRPRPDSTNILFWVDDELT